MEQIMEDLEYKKGQAFFDIGGEKFVDDLETLLEKYKHIDQMDALIQGYLTAALVCLLDEKGEKFIKATIKLNKKRESEDSQ